jgi:hypothetical protein
MKRPFLLTFSLMILIAGAVSAWASCKETSFTSHGEHPPGSAHSHDHHSDSHHAVPDGSVAHCPTLDHFLPGAAFSTGKDAGAGWPADTRVVRQHDDVSGGDYESLHGPPGFAYLTFIPPYLSFSVLRI